MHRIAILAAIGSLVLAACSSASPSQRPVIPTAAAPIATSAASTPAAAASTPTAPPATATGEPVLSHVAGTLQGGWKGPSPTEGCSRLGTGVHDYMSCYSVVSDARVSGMLVIEAEVGTALAGYGAVEIWPGTRDSKWQGRWFAASGWPRTAPGVGGEDAYGPLPADLTMDWAWLEGSGSYEGLTFVLTIANGVIDGWIYGGTVSVSRQG